MPDLDKLGLVTSRKPIIAETADGTLIEVFEWLNADAMEQAHSNRSYTKYGQPLPYVASIRP